MTIQDMISLAKKKEYKVCVWGAGSVGTEYGYKILCELGISIDYYVDGNPDLFGKEIKQGVFCKSPDEIDKSDIVFVMVSGHYVYEIEKKLREMKIEYIITYLQICEYLSKQYFDFQKEKQIAIYTCVTGGYDTPQLPEEISEIADYYCITDSKVYTDNRFKYIDINTIPECNGLDYTRQNRYCKINAHRIFQNYRYSIYFDGNITLEKSIVKYTDMLRKPFITALCRMGYNSIYAEGLRCSSHGRDSAEIFEKQLRKYWLEGMPDDYGLAAPGILVRQHNNSTCVNLMEQWWDEVKNYSKRDMISLSYILWKNDYSIDDIGVLSSVEDCIDGNDWYFERNHKKNRIG